MNETTFVYPPHTTIDANMELLSTVLLIWLRAKYHNITIELMG